MPTLTQQDLVNRVNRLSTAYRVSWEDIKYDADKAIMQINNYICSNYPLMSQVLLYPKSTYTIRVGDKDVPIFPEKYIHTVVIPFIASELLARDEEFTTIYNKYVTEYSNNLFVMFQDLFNYIPKSFQQQRGAGVFFGKDTAQARIMETLEENTPEYKFRVTYDLNNPEILLSFAPACDFSTYSYNATVKVLNIDGSSTHTNLDVISTDGAYAYIFQGWTEDANVTNPNILRAGDTIEIIRDVTLYAKWTKVSTLVCSSGAVTIKPAYYSRIKNLIVPNNIDGYRVTKITSSLFATYNGTSNLEEITLPDTLEVIEPYAFQYFVGTKVNFPKYNPVYDRPQIIIHNNAFTMNSTTSKLTEIYIPLSVRGFTANTTSNKYIFSGTADKLLNVKFETLLQNASWSTTDYILGPYATVQYGVKNG